ncbi:hypothetical protein SGRA_3805 [Saprospira grandis str. Lewin]|uniref:Uncharacterized protein n=1 Tax=Saprospira grandis (strain Lewin) TaxID=984262 RepID=H6L8F7_SAPGL|nr:hypothetical protein SGRA_3805 [Saprospira grandis str. Lewin]
MSLGAGKGRQKILILVPQLFLGIFKKGERKRLLVLSQFWGPWAKALVY